MKVSNKMYQSTNNYNYSEVQSANDISSTQYTEKNSNYAYTYSDTNNYHNNFKKRKNIITTIIKIIDILIRN